MPIRTLLAALVLLATSPASADAVLVGYAALPADTFTTGPTAGQFLGAVATRPVPFTDRQPVQGFSAILPLGGNRFLGMSDNGFGAQANSADALLLVHELEIDFRRASGGSGTVQVLGSTPLSDPHRLVNFTIVADRTHYPSAAPDDTGAIPVDPAITNRRLLTGADFDIESVRRDANGDYWFGDEFGPFLLRTNAAFELIAAPLPTPGVQAPEHPFLNGATANLPTSRGFEGMALSQDGRTLYPMLEGTVTGDPTGTLRIFEFDVGTARFTGRQWRYPLDPQGVAIGDFTQLDDTRFLVIERDGEQGEAARHKQVFRIDLTDTDPDGLLRKTLLVDLLQIADPDDLNRDGATRFRFPFVTIEAILPIDRWTLLITNDNNYPFSIGRGSDIDNSEFILVRLPEPLDLP